MLICMAALAFGIWHLDHGDNLTGLTEFSEQIAG